MKFEDKSLNLPKMRSKEFNLSVSDQTNCPIILNDMLFHKLFSLSHILYKISIVNCCPLLLCRQELNLILAMCINIGLRGTEISAF